MHLTLTNVNTHHRNQSKQKCPQKYTTNKHSDFETKLTCHIPRRVTLVFIRFVSFVDCLLPTAATHTKTTRSNSMINVLRLVVHVMITLHTNVLYPDNNDDVIASRNVIDEIPARKRIYGQVFQIIVDDRVHLLLAGIRNLLPI